jgi:hypothetical protein
VGDTGLATSAKMSAGPSMGDQDQGVDLGMNYPRLDDAAVVDMGVATCFK